MSLFHDALFERDTAAISAQENGHALRIVKGGYTFSSDPDQRLVRIAIIGFWDEAVMRDFARDLLAEVRKVDAGENRHVILCDLSGAVIQSQGTFEAFRELLLHGPTHARKLALMTGSLAMRMQAKRVVAVRDTIAMFASEGEAMDWLMGSHQA